jgi:prepilin-type N-terminal cleavage/methylation domain-containing protein
MNSRSERGFTLVEILVVLVLGSILLLATYQVLATNTRVYAENTARAQGQQTLRAGVDILSGELREISAAGGDLLGMGSDSLTIRAQRTFGLVCDVDYNGSPVKVTSFTVGPAFEVGDSIFVFHDNEAELASDDEWFVGVVSAVASNTACSGSPSQTLSIPMLTTTATASPPDSVRLGAPLRGFETITLGEYTFDGETFLGRRVDGSSDPDPMVGPLLDSRGVTFRYLDSRGQVTTVDTLVAQIEITLRYKSDMKTFQSVPVSDSVLVRVYPRN